MLGRDCWGSAYGFDAFQALDRRTGAGVSARYCAVEDLCTHAAIPLSEGSLEGCVVECSVHGARFDVSDGSVVRRPALRPLCTFPVSDELGSDESNSEGSKLRIRIHLGVTV